MSNYDRIIGQIIINCFIFAKMGINMRRNRKNRIRSKCVYCGELEVCTDEHVIPKCMWPSDARPPKSEFVIAPVCESCNGKKSADDSYARDVFVMDIDCDHTTIAQS